MDQQTNRLHKVTKSGRGGKEKKKDRRAKASGTQKERHNVRAYSVANIIRTQRTIQRNLDRGQKKEYIPLKDRRLVHQGGNDDNATPPPPSFVVVMGPPGVGKSTII